MKYIISESRLQDAIYEYIDSMFDFSNINWTHPYDVDYETGEEGENPNLIEFYNGAYSDEDILFRYYECDYYNEDSYARTICPTVTLEYPYEQRLNSVFGNKLWNEPFKKWFENNFDLKVKTVEVWDSD